MKIISKIFVIVCVIISLLFTTATFANAEESYYHLNVEASNISDIRIIYWGSEYQFIKHYDYVFCKENETDYFAYHLNSLKLIDDKWCDEVYDGTKFSIWINYSDGQTRQMGVYDYRFYDKDGGKTVSAEEVLRYPFYRATTDKQFGIDEKEYHRFFELMDALQSGAFVVPEEFSLTPSSWAVGEVDQAIEAGLVLPVFQIDYTGAISRVEVCQLIVDLLELHGYKEEVRWYTYGFEDSISSSAAMLHDLGIINGKTDTQLCPYDPITRQELAKLLSNTYRLLQGEGPAATGGLPYADRDRIGAWAVESVSDMLSLGILRGNDHNEFQPERMVTKEEVILALLRLHEAVSG